MPGMFCSSGLACSGSRLGRRIDCVRDDSRPLAQQRKAGAIAAGRATKEAGLTLDQLHIAGRSERELGPVELLLQGVKDIVVDRTLTS